MNEDQKAEFIQRMTMADSAKYTLLLGDPKNSVLDMTKPIKFVAVPKNITNMETFTQCVRESYKSQVYDVATAFPKRLKELAPAIIGEDAMATFLFLNGGYRTNQNTTETKAFRDIVGLRHAVTSDKRGYCCKCEFHRLHETCDEEFEGPPTINCSMCLDTLFEFIYANTWLVYRLLNPDGLPLTSEAFNSNAYIRLRIMMWMENISYEDLTEYSWALLTVCVQRNVVPSLLTKMKLAASIFDTDLVFSPEEEEALKTHHIRLFAPGIQEHHTVTASDGTYCKECNDIIQMIREALDYYVGVNNTRMLKHILKLPSYMLPKGEGKCHEGESNRLTYNGLPVMSRVQLGKELLAIKSGKLTGRLDHVSPDDGYQYQDKGGESLKFPKDPAKQLIWNLMDSRSKHNIDAAATEKMMDYVVTMQKILHAGSTKELSPEQLKLLEQYDTGNLPEEYAMFRNPIRGTEYDIRGPDRKRGPPPVPVPYVITVEDGARKKVYKSLEEQANEADLKEAAASATKDDN